MKKDLISISDLTKKDIVKIYHTAGLFKKKKDKGLPLKGKIMAMTANWSIDFSSGIPVYKQIINTICTAVSSGKLRQGEKLPTIKELTQQLNVNPNTVAKAYRELVGRYSEHAEHDKWQLRLGWTLYLDKQYDDAVRSLSKVLASLASPEHVAEARFLIGISQFRQSQFDAA